jgi:hypothetical protein
MKIMLNETNLAIGLKVKTILFSSEPVIENWGGGIFQPGIIG